MSNPLLDVFLDQIKFYQNLLVVKFLSILATCILSVKYSVKPERTLDVNLPHL